MYYLPEYASFNNLQEVKNLRNYVFHQRFLWGCYQNSTIGLKRALKNFAECLPNDFKSSYIDEINSSIKGLRVSSNFTIEIDTQSKEKTRPQSFYKYYSDTENNFNALEKGYLYLSKAKDFNDPNDSIISVDFNDSTSYLFDLFVDGYLKEMKTQNVANQIIESTKKTMVDQEKRAEAIKMFRDNENSSFKELLINEAKKRAITVNDRIEEVFTTLGEIFDKSQKNLKDNEKEIKDELDKIFEYLRRNEFYIGCLTNNPNSILMWTHYSNSHKGFQVKLKINKEYNEYLYPVKYTHKKPLRTLEELHKSTKKNILDNFKKEFFTKAMDWQYENEYRLIINEIESNFFDKVEVLEVTMGYNISDNNSHRLAKFCKNKNIPLKKAVLRTQSFGVDYEEVNIDDILNCN